jgi:hypothetical protein
MASQSFDHDLFITMVGVMEIDTEAALRMCLDA